MSRPYLFDGPYLFETEGMAISPYLFETRQAAKTKAASLPRPDLPGRSFCRFKVIYDLNGKGWGIGVRWTWPDRPDLPEMGGGFIRFGVGGWVEQWLPCIPSEKLDG